VSKAHELRAGSIKLEPRVLGSKFQSFRIMLLLIASTPLRLIGKNMKRNVSGFWYST
jgi:hypothetical protein